MKPLFTTSIAHIWTLTFLMSFYSQNELYSQTLTVDTYSTAGTFTWVVPACVTSVTVRVWGAGGGGAGASSTDLNGGGGGAYCMKTETVTPGETLRITVGAGGAGGVGGNGSNGGFSQVEHLTGPVVFCRAAGGSRGIRSACNSGCSGAGGSGGLISNNIPINTGFNGGNGGASDPVVASTDRGGGGGGAAGTGSAGGNGGIGRMWNTPTLNQQIGAAGNAIGGGGWGSLIHTSSIGAFTAVGGTGGRGEVRLTYNTSCPLPIELMHFSGQCVDNLKTFNWSTATEHNNEFFTIEHSRNGTEFDAILSIEGAGNSTSQINYSRNFIEEDESFIYYRLKQTDTDGESTYSDVVHINCSRKVTNLVSVSPNPSTN